MKIILEGTIEALSSRQDGTVTVKFSTQELDSSKGGELFQLRGKFCKALFSDSNITSLEAELVDNTSLASTSKNKTHSQRLRAVFFRVHQHSGTEIDFEDWYKTEMEKLITHYKNKLD